MSKYPLKLQRPRVFAFCEGETEVALFYFLKIQYWDNGSSKVSFGIAKNMGGFSDFKVFKRMYAKLVKGIGFTKKDVKDIKFLFIRPTA